MERMFLKIENVRENIEEIHIISVKWGEGHLLRVQEAVGVVVGGSGSRV